MNRTTDELIRESDPLLALEAKRIRDGLGADTVLIVITGQTPDGESWFCNHAGHGNPYALIQSAQTYIDYWEAAQIVEAEEPEE